MFCTKCGSQLEQGAHFCHKCGVAADSGQSIAHMTTGVPVQSDEKKSIWKRKLPNWIEGSLIALVIFALMEGHNFQKLLDAIEQFFSQ